MAQGKKTKVSPETLAEFALMGLSGGWANDDVQHDGDSVHKADSLAWMERLFLLNDPR